MIYSRLLSLYKKNRDSQKTPLEDFTTELLVGVLEEDSEMLDDFVNNILKIQGEGFSIESQVRYNLDSDTNCIIDIVVKNKETICFVENKVHSGEGDRQLERYTKVLKEIEQNEGKNIILRYCTKYYDPKEIQDINFQQYRWSNVYSFLEVYSEDRLVEEYLEFLRSEGMASAGDFNYEDLIVMNRVNSTIAKMDECLDNVRETLIKEFGRPGLILNENTSIPVFIRSFNLEQGELIYKLNDKYKEGMSPTGKNEIAIGEILADDLGVKSGDKIYVLTPSNEKIQLTISGILDLKVQALNKNYVVTNIENLREIYSLPSDSITSIETQLANKDIFKAEEVALNVKSSVGEYLLISNWIEQNESLLSGLKGQSASSYTIQVFIVVSVLVAIASILAITVLQKTKQIGILKAMGITDKKVSLVFIIQGGILGVFGAILGSTLGVAMFKIFQALVRNSDGTPLISGGINISFIILSALIAVVACVISSILPAIKSLRLNPVDAIKL